MGPLAGIKVIEMKGIGPGPYAGQILADLGAEVVVVERASKPNSIAAPSATDVNSRGKKSIALDIQKPEGLSALLSLIDQTDVVFEGNRPGVAERLGFGPDVCIKRNPKLIYGRVTGWGQTGPLAKTAGHDYNYISLTGVAAAIGPMQQSVPPLNLIGDYAGGSLFLVVGILSALLEVKQSGKGQVIDASITDGSAHLMSLFYTLSNLNLWQTSRQSNLLDGAAPFYRAYETADQKQVSVAAIEPPFFAKMIEKTDLPRHFIATQNNPETWPELEAALSDTFKSKTRAQWGEIFADSDACVSGILNYREAVEDPHNKARGTYIDIDGLKQPAPAPKFSRTRCPTPDAPSAEGVDTKTVLAKWGFEQSAIDTLEAQGVFT